MNQHVGYDVICIIASVMTALVKYLLVPSEDLLSIIQKDSVGSDANISYLSLRGTWTEESQTTFLSMS